MVKSKIPIPCIYPIIDDSIVPFDKIGEITKALIAGGAKIVQLRVKRLSSKVFLKSARIIRKITRDSSAIFIVNDRVDIALLAEADGVHLGQDDLPVKEARKLLGNNKIIGYSTHNIREALEAVRLPVDYISFGPIFLTKTKHDAQTPKGIQGLAEVRKAVDIPIVAIGGITETNMIHVFQEGADSVAMISDILTASDISKKVNRLIRIVGLRGCERVKSS
ncbi:MAG: thiamine-phosphate diphosphorylase [Deltaproteobacteria bacterium RIFCSPLOWO2_12_FULL_43_16]|nr:MAG: thiamine-phosphate diphosphorylase [Deltaproteobacteria bacterium GWA2_43_19]OGQ12309.1 MAG: thiamine-phosphate diphosphorylase [Deltaproteobacteria bacterium RIFCSPHIGHO2_02_FULL_43_33]OGQ35172.1 MAG: thiamine-phosphate diphosphorylase [Deltaproteobacteria bacterium RIFCSPLOWO2_01_FULL_42_9]OGQ57257.1 MAG: thiamine-phosphate diphosphorylase [Deltaproteobacteria bacterium RIFCSPLOWO2_12_FULL_43_16]